MSKKKETVWDLIAEESYERARLLADAHASWFAQMSETIYRQAFVHGYRHGRKDREAKKG